MGEFNVNKSDGSLEQTAGMPSEYPATQVMMSDGVTSVEDALDEYYDNKSGTVLATATADGVKTYAQLLVELYPYIENGCYIDIDNNRLYGNNVSNYGCVAAGGSNKIRLYAVYLTSTTAYYLRDEISNSGAVTFTDLSSTVPANGNKVKLIRI